MDQRGVQRKSRISSTGTSGLLRVLGFAAFLSGCQDASQPPPQIVKVPTIFRSDAAAASADAALGGAIASYVGLTQFADGAYRITLANPAEFPAAEEIARRAWENQAGERIDLPAPRFTLIQATLGRQELVAAFGKMRDVLVRPKVTLLDLDESCGCIVVGIAEPGIEADVRTFAASQGISQDVIRTKIVAPFVPSEDIRGKFRPTKGGMQIKFNEFWSCTMGLPVYSYSRKLDGFLTNSHCTTGPRGALERTYFGQPGGQAGDGIGRESLDAGLVTQATDPRCPTGSTCRYSDAAFADFIDVPNMGIRGRIVRPRATCATLGQDCDTAVDRWTDDIRVTELASGFPATGLSDGSGLTPGTVVQKVGRTTGWTSGTILQTCADVPVANDDGTQSGMVMLCQGVVAGTSKKGDSGSPVFRFSPETGTAMFVGLLWGGGGSGAGSTLAYSPISGIERELGTFVYQQAGVASPFYGNGEFYTSDTDDDLNLLIERNAVPSNEIEVVLKMGEGTNSRKEIVLVEGHSNGANGTAFPITVDSNTTSAKNGLFTYQLEGGRLEFRKQFWNGMAEVSRVPLDKVAGGTRLTFTWRRD